MKDAKSTKQKSRESEYKTFDAILQFGVLKWRQSMASSTCTEMIDAVLCAFAFCVEIFTR